MYREYILNNKCILDNKYVHENDKYITNASTNIINAASFVFLFYITNTSYTTDAFYITNASIIY